MAQLRVLITAQSPLCFSERRPGGQFRTSTEFVSGAVLRGAAAGVMVRDGLEGEVDFQRLFGVGQPAQALFRCAYPGDGVLPATALSCKDYSGFRTTAEAHGVFDGLITMLCFEQLQPPGFLYIPKCLQADCEPGRADAFAGFYTQTADGYRQRRVPQRLLTRVSINRQRMAAEPELLYSPVVLTEAWWEGGRPVQAQFSGTVTVEDALADRLSTALQAITHLGSGAARGLGQVSVVCEAVPSVDEMTERITAIRHRAEAFQAQAEADWSALQPLCLSPPDCPQVFTVNLRSDAILKQRGWLPTTVLTPELLREAIGVQGGNLTLLRSVSSHDYRGGWHTARRLPKDTELITRRGSVFVFAVDDLEAWLEPLARLELRGIGLRTEEGFGEVRICDAFHVEGRNRL